MAVGVCHQLIGFLAGGIKAHRVVDRLLLMEGQILIAAIDRTARGVDEVLDVVVTAAFQQMAKAHKVALDVGRGILQGITNTGLSGEVHNHLRLLSSEQSHQGITVLQSHFREAPVIF